jgi:hypothetical protein
MVKQIHVYIARRLNFKHHELRLNVKKIIDNLKVISEIFLRQKTFCDKDTTSAINLSLYKSPNLLSNERNKRILMNFGNLTNIQGYDS